MGLPGFSALRRSARVSLSPAGEAVVTKAKVAASAEQRPLPGWYRDLDFDLDRAADGLAALLANQGVPAFGPDLKKVIFTDVDQTLLDTRSPVPFKSKTNPTDYLLNPDTGDLLLLGVSRFRDNGKEMAALRARWPRLDWARYFPDFGADMNAVGELLRSESIAPQAAHLKKQTAKPGTRALALTARSGDSVAVALRQLSKDRALGLSGYLLVNNPSMRAALGLDATAPGTEVSSAQAKAVVMAAALRLAQRKGATVRTVAVNDDSDDNLKAAAQLLPALYPEVKLKLVDMRYTAREGYHRVPVATFKPGKGFIDGHKRPVGAAELEAYGSHARDTFQPVPGMPQVAL